jgi:hypothetical protein
LCKIPFNVVVENYFRIVDNDDTGLYSETGTWYTSVAQAYGPSSRYANIQSTLNGPAATFTFMLSRNGISDIYEILPLTVNSANNALYKIIANGVMVDSFYLNQNEGSGNWKNIGRYFLPTNKQIIIKVMDTGESTSGPVIRADAFKIALYQETTSADENILNNTPNAFQLFQNYPNPFNSSTAITWQQPASGFTSLKIYDVLGNEIDVLMNKEIAAGNHKINFDAAALSSGMYIYKLRTGNYVENKKMILMK